MHGTVGLADFFLPARDDPATAAMAAKFDPLFDASLINPVGLEPGLLEITTTDGRVLSARVDAPKGHHTRPLSLDDMARKFRRLASLAAAPLPPERIERIIATIAALDTMPDVRGLTTLLVPETIS